MKHVVITGSTRGIGYGLAVAFLNQGCSVTVSGRFEDSVDQVVNDLISQLPGAHLNGLACDVRDPVQVQVLWDTSVQQFGKVDIWVNNAGYSGPQLPAWKIDPAKAKEIIETNLLGGIYGSVTAIRGMKTQGHGAIYNMEGMGSDGRMHPGLTFYGTSNAGRHYFNQSLIKEAEGNNLIIGTLHPGMVVTDLLTKQYDGRPEDWERDKRIFNILAERVDTVAPWMAARMLENKRSGTSIRFTTKSKIMLRFLTSPFSRRDLFEDINSKTRF